MKRNLSFLAAVLFAVAPSALQAQTITQWNFNSTTNDAATATGSTAPSTGAGSLSLVGGVTNTFAAGSPGDPNTTDNSGLNTTAYPAQGTGSGTAGTQFNVSTLGSTGSIQISLDFRQSGTISRYFQLQLSTDGIAFVNAAGGVAAVATPGTTNTLTSFTSAGLYTNNPGNGTQNFVQGISYTLPAGSGYENNAAFAFRWVSVFDPTGTNGNNYISANAGTTAAYSGGGTARFDLVTVGAAVPEPSTTALVGALGVGLIVLARRRRHVQA